MMIGRIMTDGRLSGRIRFLPEDLDHNKDCFCLWNMAQNRLFHQDITALPQIPEVLALKAHETDMLD